MQQSFTKLREASSVFKALQNHVSTTLRFVCASQHTSKRDKRERQRRERENLDFLGDDERCVLVRESGSFRLSLYKVFLFQHIATAIKAGNLNLSHSYKYRPMDSYLIDADRWNKEREQLLETFFD